MKSNSIVFCGGGEISLATLKPLAQHFSIEAIITKPDTVLRGKSHSPTIKLWAEQQGIKVWQPATKAELAALVEQQQFTSPVAVIAEYGLIIPATVIDYFPLGMVNSHFSLLPRWRGADPIRAAILSGDRLTGISIIKITPELDDGDILASTECPLGAKITTPQLTQQLIALNNKLLPPTLTDYLTGQITPQPQAGDPSYAPKIDKAAGQIDWQKPAVQLEREVRAYLGWPGSYTVLGGIEIAVTQAGVQSAPTTHPGRIIIERQALAVETGQDLLVIEQLKPAGKAKMDASAFLAGYRQRLITAGLE